MLQVQVNMASAIWILFQWHLSLQLDPAGSPVRGGLLQEGAGLCSPAHVGHLVLCSALQGKH